MDEVITYCLLWNLLAFYNKIFSFLIFYVQPECPQLWAGKSQIVCSMFLFLLYIGLEYDCSFKHLPWNEKLHVLKGVLEKKLVWSINSEEADWILGFLHNQPDLGNENRNSINLKLSTHGATCARAPDV